MSENEFQCIYKPTGEKFKPFKIDFGSKAVYGSFDGSDFDYCHYSLDGNYGDAILRRYTEINDKNNIELYYGDKVKMFFGRNEQPGTDTISNLEDLVTLINYMEDLGATFEIVGNVHEEEN